MNADNLNLYTDFSGFAKMRVDSRQAPEEAVTAVAKQFESLFMQMMLKSMREASHGDPNFDSNNSQLYRDMFDKQLAMSLSEGKGIGLADALVQQFKQYIPKDAEHSAMAPVISSASVAMMQKTAPVQSVVMKEIPQQTVEQPTLVQPIIAQVSIVPEVVPDNTRAEFSSPKDFVEKLWPLAQTAAEKLGTRPEVLVAQSALETGWGKFISKDANGQTSNNLFNIKAGKDWEGKRVSIETVEFRNGRAVKEQADFRAYDSLEDSLADYVSFLQTSPRYEKALEHAENPEVFIQLLHKAGYATDPNYSDKVTNIINRESSLFNNVMASLTGEGVG